MIFILARVDRKCELDGETIFRSEDGLEKYYRMLIDREVCDEVCTSRRVLKRRRRRTDGSDLLWFCEMFLKCFPKKRLALN